MIGPQCARSSIVLMAKTYFDREKSLYLGLKVIKHCFIVLVQYQQLHYIVHMRENPFSKCETPFSDLDFTIFSVSVCIKLMCNSRKSYILEVLLV